MFAMEREEKEVTVRTPPDKIPCPLPWSCSIPVSTSCSVLCDLGQFEATQRFDSLSHEMDIIYMSFKFLWSSEWHKVT